MAKKSLLQSRVEEEVPREAQRTILREAETRYNHELMNEDERLLLLERIRRLRRELGVLAIVVALFLSVSAQPASAEDTVCGGPNFKGVSDSELIELVNSMDDEQRFCALDNGELPEAPEGYAYHEDLSISPIRTDTIRTYCVDKYHPL
jgi:hypothetical protein